MWGIFLKRRRYIPKMYATKEEADKVRKELIDIYPESSDWNRDVTVKEVDEGQSNERRRRHG